MLRVLVTTASRRLLDTPRARAWLQRRYERFLPRYDVLMTGDASSDKLAIDVATTLGKPSYSFALDEHVYMNGWAEDRNPLKLVKDRWAVEGARAQHDPDRWPLVRNEALILAAVSLVRPENVYFAARSVETPLVEVKVLACCCPWATKHGTEHTRNLALSAELPVRTRTCPERYGP